MILIYKKQKREDSVQEEREGTKSGKELQTWKARLKSLVPILDWLIWTPTTIGMICKLFFNQFFAMFLLQIKLLLKGNVLRPRLEENVFVLNLEWNKNVYFFECILFILWLHVLKLIHTSFRVSFPNFTKSFVLIPSLFDVFLMESIILGHFGLVLVFCQFLTQHLQAEIILIRKQCTQCYIIWQGIRISRIKT